VPWGLIGAIALGWAAEAALARHEAMFLKGASWDWRLSRRAAQGPAKGCAVLVFGDSLVKYGLVPEILRERLGGDAYNLALSGGPAPASYALLRRALEAGARPSAIVVDALPLIQGQAPGRQPPATLWAELLGLREAFDLAWTARDARLFAEILLARALPSVRARREVAGNLRTALAGGHGSEQDRPLHWWRNLNRNRGALVQAPRPIVPAEIDGWARGFTPSAWPFDRTNRAYLDRFLELAARHRIPVYWIIPPVHPELQARSERTGFDALYSRFVRNVQAKYDNLTIIDGRRLGYPASLFADPLHLDRRGATTFSMATAEVIADRRNPARWVALPPHRGTPIERPLEDVEQSRIAVFGAGRVFR
jgi:hypothetical protein